MSSSSCTAATTRVLAGFQKTRGTSSSKLRTARGLVIIALALCGACDGPKPCRGSIKEGASFDVEIVEKWDENSQYAFEAPPAEVAELYDISLPSCQIDDVKLGDTYRWKINDTRPGDGYPDDCYYALCPDDFPTLGKRFSRGSLGINQGAFACTSSDQIAKVRDCEIGRFVGLMSVDDSADLFDEPRIGKKPPAVVVRRYLFSPENSELQCADATRVFPEEAMMSWPPPGLDFVDPQEPSNYWECADAWVVRLKKK